MSSSTDKELIAKAQQNNKQAIAALYEKYVDKMTRYVSYRVGSLENINDIVGNIFLIMLERLPDYQWTGAPFEAWLYKIAQAQVAMFYRKTKQVVALNEIEVGEFVPLDINITRLEEFQQMRQALQKLDEEQQDILILRFVESKTHDEVANILDKTPGAIMTAQHRALKRLAHYLGQEDKAHYYLRGDQTDDK